MEFEYLCHVTPGVCDILVKELSIRDSLNLASTCRQLRSDVLGSLNFIMKVADFKGKIKGFAQYNPAALLANRIPDIIEQDLYSFYLKEVRNEHQAFRKALEEKLVPVECDWKGKFVIIHTTNLQGMRVCIFEGASILLLDSRDRTVRCSLTIIKIFIGDKISINAIKTSTNQFTATHCLMQLQGSSTMYHDRKQSLKRFFLNDHPQNIANFPHIIQQTLLHPPKREICGISSKDAELPETCNFITGPAGSGKTETILKVVSQEIKKGESVLIMTSQNAVADSIACRLTNLIPCIYRINSIQHSQCIDTELKRFCALTELQKVILNQEIVGDFIKFEYRLRQQIIRNLEHQPLIQVKQKMQLVYFYRRWIHLIFQQPTAIISTPASAQYLNPNMKFKLIIVDESECMQNVDLFSAVLRVEEKGKIGFFGDPNQLVPFSYTGNTNPNVFSVAVNRGNGFVLKTQYRSVPEIFSIVHTSFRIPVKTEYDIKRDSYIFADGKHTRVITHSSPDRMIGSEGREEGASEASYINYKESLIIAQLVKELPNLVHGFKISDLAVLTMYSSQKYLLSSVIPHVKVSTVDAFQGQERKIVILSLVRQNNYNQFGFVANKNRAYTALTRASEILIIVCGKMFLNNHAPEIWREILYKAK